MIALDTLAARLLPRNARILGLSAMLSLGSLGVAIRFLLPRLTTGFQAYDDIIASSIPYYDTYKSGDVIFAFSAAALSLGVFFLASFLGNRFCGGGESFSSSEEVGCEKAEAWLERAILLYFAAAGALSFISWLHGAWQLPKLVHVGLLLLCGSLAYGLRGRRAGWIPWISIALPFLLFRFLRFDLAGVRDAAPIVPGLTFRLLIAALFFGTLYRGIRKAKRRETKISPDSIVLISSFLAFHLPTGNALSLDAYHTGEMLIPFQQIWDFGMRLNSDFVSVHGMLAVIHGLVHRLFLDGTYATAPLAFALVEPIFAAFGAAALCFAVRRPAALLLSLFVLPSLNRFYLFPIVFAVLAASWFRGRRAWWLVAALLSVCCALVFNYAPGLGIFLATTPWFIFQCLNGEAPGSRWRWAVLLGLLVAIGFSHPLAGAFRFISMNGHGTLQAFGLPLNVDHNPPSILQSAFFGSYRRGLGAGFKLFKVYGWMAGLVATLSVVAWRRNFTPPILFAALFAILFSCSLIPYTFGRIGTDGLDRVGAMTVLILGFVLPLVAELGRRRSARLGFALLIAGVFLRSFPYLKDFAFPTALASAAVQVSPGSERFTGAAPAALGAVYAKPEELMQQQEFGEFLSRNDPAHDGYFDFTNRQIFYLIHARPARYLYPSQLLATNEEIQAAVVEKLEAHPPRIVWVGPADDHEQFKASLRSYRPYRWLMEHGYTERMPSSLSNFAFLRRSPAKPNLDQLAAIFFTKDLGFLPAAWGRSWRDMAKRFRTIGPPGGSTTNGIFRFEVGPKLSELHPDYAILRARGAGGLAVVSFLNEEGTVRSSEFLMKRGQESYLIPLGADPRWLLAEKIRAVEISIAGLPEWQGDLELLRLEE